ncbi:DNA gyrase subunit A, partial [Bacillus pumilus]|uniref:DNA gyrase subunit A n=1 Tax=Bacillus pumilus TaxID=1408 RepID=UPI0011A0C55F
PPLPHVRHPLNPLHPTIFYPINHLPITTHKPFNKSPPILPQLIPNYHPHPHTPLYQPILRIPQHFNYPYILVHPHRNFRSLH